MTIDLTFAPWIFAGASFVVMLILLLSGRKSRSEERIAELSGAGASQGAMPLGAAPGGTLIEQGVARRLKEDKRKAELKDRLVQAGLYGRGATVTFMTVRLLSVAIPVVIGAGVGFVGLAPMAYGLLIGLVVGVAGLLAPSFWLDHVKSSRQKQIRRALPDALDVISVCLEGGMSLPSALSRVARELATAHPKLALELAIVERETRMGRTTGEAMKAFAARFDLEELRSLASVIVQAERFGSSVTHAMQVYSETLRQKRHQRAEEMAQKAVIKIIFPTLFCIFPGIFVVILGPAAIQIYQVLIKGSALKGGF